MSKSVIYTVNTTTQEIADGGTVALGSIVRRYGCNLVLSGNTILISGPGYYSLDCTVITAPTAAGTITATLYRNGVELPGSRASFTVAAADDVVTLPIIGEVRQVCACQEPIEITCVLSGVESSVSNVTFRVKKD